MGRLASTFILLASIQAQPACAQWMLGAYIGWAAPFKTNVRIDSQTGATDVRFDHVPFQTRSFDGPLYYGIRAGRMFSPGFGAEVEMTHLKIFAQVDTPVIASGTIQGATVSGVLTPRSIVEQLNVSHGLNMVLANVVTHFPFGTASGGRPRAILTARFGVGPTLPHTEAVLLGVAAEHYESGGVAIQVAGGMEFPVWKDLHVLGEYKYTTTRQHLTVGSAAVELTPGTHHLVTGFAYHFR